MGEMPERLYCWVREGDLPHGPFYGAREMPGHTEYLRADLATPRPWSTVEELEALPVGSVVLDKDGDAFQSESQHFIAKQPETVWHLRGDSYRWSAHEVAALGPGVILHIPAAP